MNKLKRLSGGHHEADLASQSKPQSKKMSQAVSFNCMQAAHN